MYIIPETPNPSGAYPSPQTWGGQTIPDGYVLLPDGFDLSDFYAHNGFVTLEIRDGEVAGITPNLSAWEAWRASLPPADDPLEQVKEAKLAELSAACSAAITAGCDVVLTDCAGHIALTAEDQINLSTALAAVEQGAAGYPYHLDGQLCAIFPAADICTMAQAATAHKLYHTTYYNHLAAWVRRCETAEEVQAISYGAQLPEDLAENMAAVLAAAGGNTDAM